MRLSRLFAITLTGLILVTGGVDVAVAGPPPVCLPGQAVC